MEAPKRGTASYLVFSSVDSMFSLAFCKDDWIYKVLKVETKSKAYKADYLGLESESSRFFTWQK